MNPRTHSEELLIFTFLGLAGAILGYLIYPGRPSESQVMTFEGFIELPSSGRLTILDYLTLNDKVLFVFLLQVSRRVPRSKSLSARVT